MSVKKNGDIVISLVVVIAIEALGWAISVGYMMNKMDALELRVSDTEDAIENLHKVNNRLIRIEVLMESVVVGNAKITENMAIVAAEQQKRGIKIDEAFDHSKNVKQHFYSKEMYK